MKDIKQQIEIIKNNVSKIEDDRYKIVLEEISNVLENIQGKVETIMVNQAVLAENFRYMNEDISGIQDELFEELSIEELDEIEDIKEEYIEVKCDNCGKIFYMESSITKNHEKMACPYCNKKTID